MYNGNILLSMLNKSWIFCLRFLGREGTWDKSSSNSSPLFQAWPLLNIRSPSWKRLLRPVWNENLISFRVTEAEKHPPPPPQKKFWFHDFQYDQRRNSEFLGGRGPSIHFFSINKNSIDPCYVNNKCNNSPTNPSSFNEVDAASQIFFFKQALPSTFRLEMIVNS